MSSAFRPKAYLRPKDETELSALLREHGERARIIAGGTGIYEVGHRGLLSGLESLLDISHLGLSYVKEEKSSTFIGAGTTLSELSAAKEIVSRREFGSVTDALTAIQPTQVKNVATVGGAICTALPFLDLPVALMALDALVGIAPGKSKKPLLDFIKGYFAVDLGEDELVRQVEIPHDRFQKRFASAFLKFAMTSDDWALINCGVSLSLEENGRIKDPRIIYGGGIGEKPVRASEVEKSVAGLEAGSEIEIKAVFDRDLPKDIETVSDIRSSAEHRMRLAKVIGRRATLQAIERVKGVPK